MGTIVEPPDISVIFAKPGRGWSPEERIRVIQWLHEPPQFRYLRTFAKRHLGPPATEDDAQDAWQEFCAKELHSVIQSYNPAKGVRFWGYLLVCLKRFCWAEGERIRRRRQQEQPPPEVETADGSRIELEFADPDPYTNPEKALELKELRELLTQCINELPFPLRQVFVLYYFQEWPIKEIANHLKISEALAKVRLFRARQKLRDCLRKKGWPQ
jgi:RNA polymerase sigma factor (sigma-70 family)